VTRRRLARFAAPAAFLAVITVAALLIRAGLERGNPQQRTTPPAGTTPATTTTRTATSRHAGVRTYRVQVHDTFESIARRLRTTVARLEQLNPGVDPNTLQVGQKIRVQ
jgi:LysM repeat protein